MILRCLGELRLGDGAFARRKPLLLLCYLALEGPQERGRIAQTFWPDGTDARNRLSVALSRIRSDVPDALDVDAETVKTTLRTDVQAWREAIERLDFDAAQGWMAGPFLDGISTSGLGLELEEWIHDTRENIARTWQAALVTDAERVAARGGFAAAAQRAERAWRFAPQVAPEPALLARIHALLVAGGSPEAAELRDETEGFDVDLAATEYEARAALMAAAPPTNLPRRMTSFVGRQQELASVHRALDAGDRSLITLLGPGGIGKTRLALAIADAQAGRQRFGGGVIFVGLESLEDPNEIAPTILAAIGGSPRPGETHTDAVIRTIGQRHMLLLLDNFDHLTDGALVVSDLLAACPSLFVLVTSRTRLDLMEESVFPLDGLNTGDVDVRAVAKTQPSDRLASRDAATMSEAVRLFFDRAQRARMDFQADDEQTRAIEELCRLVGGAPLGIELAAVWVRRSSPAEILADLRTSFDALVTPARNASPRHRSLRASFEFSWQLLDPEERNAIQRLAVFRGGFDEAAAERVTAVSPELLDDLLAHSLLERDVDGRFGMHPLISAFVQETLAEQPETEELLRAEHARWIATVVAEAETHMFAAGQQRVVGRLEREQPNLVAALAWAADHKPELGLEIASYLRLYWRYSGRFADGLAFAKRVLAATPVGPSRHRVRVLAAAASMLFRLGRFAEARVLAEEARAEAESVEDAEVVGEAAQVLGNIAHDEGSYEEAEACFLFALEHAERAAAPRLELEALTGLGRVAAAHRDFERARGLFERCLALGEERGSEASIATATFNLGAIARDHSDWDAAERNFERCLASDTAIGYRLGVAHTLRELGGVSAAQGDIATALRRFHQALALSRSLDDGAGTAQTLAHLGHVSVSNDAPGKAVEHYRDAIDSWRALGDEAHVPRLLRQLAAVLEKVGRLEESARALGAEHTTIASTGGTPPESETVERAARIDRLRRRLGRETFEACWDAGRVEDVHDGT